MKGSARRYEGEMRGGGGEGGEGVVGCAGCREGRGVGERGGGVADEFV